MAGLFFISEIHLKNSFILYLLAFCLYGYFSPAKCMAADIFQSGEELIYNVSYFGINIGKVEILSSGTDDVNSIECFKTITKINTYPGISFVDFRVIYREWMDRSLHYTHKFITNTYYDEDDWGYGEINFNYTNDNITIKSWRQNELEFEKYFETNKKYCNGITLIFLMRKHAAERKSLIVPACLNNDTTYCLMNMSGIKESIYVKAMKKNVNCYHTTGKIEMSGLYGLAGDFELWITDDDARIPVLGKVNIIIGSAVIELISIKRL